MTEFLPTAILDGDEEHNRHHERLHEHYNGNVVQVPLAGPGSAGIVTGGGSGAANTALIELVIADVEPGTTLQLPPGRIDITPVVADKLVNVEGHGRGGTIFVALGNSADAYWEWAFSTPTLYSRLARVGFDMTASPLGTAFRAGPNAFWWELEHVNMEGGNGALAIDSQAMNGRVNWVRASDFTTYLKAVEGGLELTLEHFVMERLLAGTSTDGILIDAPGVGTIKGAVYGHDVRFAKVVGTANCALRAISDDDPGFTVPLFFERAIFDNINGPAVQLEGIWRSVFANGWFASAAGTTSAVQIDGGGQLQFSHNQLFGGSGANGCSYEFLGATDRFTSIGNHLHTGPSYKIGAAQPTNFLLDDDHYGGLLSNDMTKLHAAMLPRGDAHTFKRTDSDAGFATLGSGGTPGEVAIPCPRIHAATSMPVYGRRALVGVPGHLYVKSVTTGVGFTLASVQDDGVTPATETSLLWWTLETVV